MDEGEDEVVSVPIVGLRFCEISEKKLVLSKLKAWTWGNYNVTDTSLDSSFDSSLLLRVEGKLSLRWTRNFFDYFGDRILRIHKKRNMPSLLEAFSGEEENKKKLFSVKCCTEEHPQFSLKAFVAPKDVGTEEADFQLEGRYFENEYVIWYGKQAIAHVKRKPEASSFVLGCGAYSICVDAGVDYVLVVSLVLIMDELHLETSVVHH